MDILYLLVPFSIFAIFGIMGLFAWALERGQFDELEQQGSAIFDEDARALIDIKAAD